MMNTKSLAKLEIVGLHENNCYAPLLPAIAVTTVQTCKIKVNIKIMYLKNASLRSKYSLG